MGARRTVCNASLGVVGMFGIGPKYANRAAWSPSPNTPEMSVCAAWHVRVTPSGRPDTRYVTAYRDTDSTLIAVSSFGAVRNDSHDVLSGLTSTQMAYGTQSFRRWGRSHGVGFLRLADLPEPALVLLFELPVARVGALRGAMLRRRRRLRARADRSRPELRHHLLGEQLSQNKSCASDRPC